MRARAICGHGARGPACFLVETDGRRFLLDLGEGPDAGARPDLSAVGRIDAILVSHGHPDHVDALDLAAVVGDPPIHATAIVRALARDARLAAARDLPAAGRTEIAGIVVETGPAGHAPGAVWIRLGGSEGLLYTGDFSREGILHPFAMPPPTRLCIADAAYGTHDRPLAEGIEALIGLARRGPLLLPAPPAGRGLEMAVVFAEAGFEVGLCPVHLRTAAVVLAHADAATTPEGRDRLAAVLARVRPLDAGSPARGVMIAAGPNAEAGTSARLAARFARSGEAAIVFTGHVAEGFAGQRLIASGRASAQRWNVHPRLCDLIALCAAIAPEAILPAFLPEDGLRELAAALPVRTIAPGAELA
jgi:glyoxylase-like metal-dependent hydrolase (beta-lactamase superfamily II)